MLPWDDRAYDEKMPLRDLGTLLPYHTHVDPGSTVSALNRMIDDVAAGKTVFHELYTDAEMQRDPTKRNAGLFFFRGKPGAPFSVIAPGGGFSYVGSVHEGFPHAAEISRMGYNAFVLKYRVGHGGRLATEDLAMAIAYIFRNASKLEISTGGYSLWGSSAGARMAAAIGSHGTARFGGPALPKPSAVVMAYTAHSDLAAEEPATFVVVGEHDGISPRRCEGEWMRYARPGRKSSIANIAASATASALGSARQRKDGLGKRSASGQDRKANKESCSDDAGRGRDVPPRSQHSETPANI